MSIFAKNGDRVIHRCFEASPAPTLTNTPAAIRKTNGCVETDNNSADFATGPPNPRNTWSPVASCGGSTNPSGSGTASRASVGAGASTRLTRRGHAWDESDEHGPGRHRQSLV